MNVKNIVIVNEAQKTHSVSSGNLDLEVVEAEVIWTNNTTKCIKSKLAATLFYFSVRYVAYVLSTVTVTKFRN